MEADHCTDPAVDYPHHRLSEDLYQYEASELTVPIGEEDYHLSVTFHWNTSVTEGFLNEIEYLLPVGCVRRPFLGPRHLSPAEVLVPHTQAPPQNQWLHSHCTSHVTSCSC